MDVEETIMTAVGGANVTQTIEGRQRFPVNVRYGRELRADLTRLKRVLVATPEGAQVPLGDAARRAAFDLHDTDHAGSDIRAALFQFTIAT
jgi:Cu/Ag efflux pump CusA